MHAENINTAWLSAVVFPVCFQCVEMQIVLGDGTELKIDQMFHLRAQIQLVGKGVDCQIWS